LQHNLQIGERQNVNWGATVETSGKHSYESFAARGRPVGQRTNLFSTFAQYEASIVPDRLRLIAGSSFEYNTYTGFAVQPQIRGVWTPNNSHTHWAAVSRAISIPAGYHVGEEYLFGQVPGKIPTFLTAAPNPSLGPETVRAYELGYRFSPSKIFFLDTAIFYNHYEGLINLNLVNPLSVSGAPRVYTDPLYAEILVPWQNLGPGQTHGLEVYGTLRPAKTWMLSAGVTELRGNGINLNDALNLPMLNSPRHQFNAQSHWDVNSRIGFDVCLYHYNGIRGYIGGSVPWQNVPTHNRVDAGLTVRAAKDWIVSLWAKDIGAPPHWENRAPLFTTGGSQTRGQAITLGLQWSARADAAEAE
jgi:iron complex outermembrane receptor protein